MTFTAESSVDIYEGFHGAYMHGLQFLSLFPFIKIVLVESRQISLEFFFFTTVVQNNVADN